MILGRINPVFFMDGVSRVFRFYLDGFRSMVLGKTLWRIIFIKLFIIFAVFKLFFFHDFLDARYDNDREKANHVLEQLVLSPDHHLTRAHGRSMQ
jgi:hypothetical protein